jgi:hypothetical protein
VLDAISVGSEYPCHAPLPQNWATWAVVGPVVVVEPVISQMMNIAWIARNTQKKIRLFLYGFHSSPSFLDRTTIPPYSFREANASFRPDSA